MLIPNPTPLRQNLVYFTIWFAWFTYILLNYLLVGRIILKPIIDLLAITGLAITVHRFSKIKVPLGLKVWVAWGLLICAYLVIHGLTTGHIANLLEHRYDHFRLFLLLPFLAVLTCNYRPSLEIVCKGLVITGLFAGYLTVLFFANGSPYRGAGVIGKPIIHGNLGMLSAILCLVCFFALQSKRWKALALISIISGISLSVLSGSRGGWPAFVIASFTIFLFLRKVHPRAPKVIYVTGALLLLCTALFWEYLPIHARLQSLISDLELYFKGNPATSVGYRLQFWQVSWNSFLDSPLFGAGIDTFNQIWVAAIKNGEARGSTDFYHSHNDFLMMMSQLGMAGLIMLLGWILWPTYYLIKLQTEDHPEVVNYWILLAIVTTEAMLEFMLTNNAFFTRPLYESFVIVVLFCLAQEKIKGLDSGISPQ